MRLSILGPLEVTHGGTGRVVPLRGDKQRRLLLALLLGRGDVVARDRLLEVVWPEGGLTDARNALQVKVSQLRRVLADGEAVELRSTPTGYLLDIPTDAVDAWRFEALVGRARAAAAGRELVEAEELLTEALGLWRGAPLAELADEVVAAPTAAALEELRAAATELHAEVLLDLGRHHESIAASQELLVAQPLRERAAGLLVTALGRAGRQADAIDVFQRTRRVLGDELGVDPGPELQRRYEQLLRQEGHTVEPIVDPPSTHRSATPPVPIASFVGRASDVARVRTLVDGARLVTLTGPGGVGKTRLALEAVRGRASAVAGSTWWVELAPIQPGADLTDAMLHALGSRESLGSATGDGAPFERLVLALAGDPGLLVLDNAEHLLEDVADLVHGLLRRIETLTVLCTSREALGLRGELVWSVPSMSLPPAGVDGSDVTASEAVELFVTRAREADPGFQSDDVATVAAVAALCRRLDGIPLALELAAARVPVLSPAEVLRRFELDRSVLRTRDPTAPARQRTLQHVIDWSWRLLDDDERALCRRLGVFRGGWTLPDAERVCAGDGLPRDRVVEVLDGLVRKSLVTVHADRYGSLETLRDHALRQLDAADEVAVTRGRHAGWVADLVAEQVPRLRTAGQLDAVATLDRELPNLREALSWLTTADPASGARIAVDAGWYWYLRDHRTEGRRWLSELAPAAPPEIGAMATLWDRFLALEEVPTTELRDDIEAAAAVVDGSGLAPQQRATAHLVAAFTASMVGAGEAAGSHLGRARAIASEAGDGASLATADFVEARDRLAHGDLVTGRTLAERALVGFRAVGDRWGQVQCLIALVGLARMGGDAGGGIDAAREGIALAEELGLGELRAVLWAGLGMQHVTAGDTGAARTAIATAREVAASLGSRAIDTQIEVATADLAAHLGDLAAAAAGLERCLGWLDRLQAAGAASMVLLRLGQVEEQRGRLHRARERYEAAHRAAAGAGDEHVAEAARARLIALADTAPERPAPRCAESEPT